MEQIDLILYVGRRLLTYGGGSGYAQAASGMHIRLRKASMCSATCRLARIRCSFWALARIGANG